MNTKLLEFRLAGFYIKKWKIAIHTLKKAK